jgi:hypothetical protein
MVKHELIHRIQNSRCASSSAWQTAPGLQERPIESRRDTRVPLHRGSVERRERDASGSKNHTQEQCRLGASIGFLSSPEPSSIAGAERIGGECIQLPPETAPAFNKAVQGQQVTTVLLVTTCLPVTSSLK